MDNLTITIAGPGTGKTHDLKDQVLKCLPEQANHRYCIVITYTNAATEELRTRISSEIKIPPNLFIGTIHSFLIRFIIDPYGHLLNYIGIEKVYVDRIILDLHKYYGSITQKAITNISVLTKENAKEIISYLKKTHFVSNNNMLTEKFNPERANFRLPLPDQYSAYHDNILDSIRNNCVYNSQRRNEVIKQFSINIANKSIKNNLVVYDQIIGLSLKILNSSPILCKHISNRLQYIFIDEYQDTRLNVHEIIQLIHKQGKTNIYYIGDPLQSIFEFSYQQSQIQEKRFEKFEESPLKQLQIKNKAIIKKLQINHRSSKKIVKLINNFIMDEQCKQIDKTDNEMPVFFIKSVDTDEIINIYLKLYDEYNLEEIHNAKKFSKRVFRNLILTRYWPKSDARREKLQDLYNALITHTGIKLEKGNYKLTSYLQEISRCIQSAICEKKNILIDHSIQEEIRYRMFCFYVIRKIREKRITNRDEQIHFIKKVLIKGFPYSEHSLKENVDQYEIPLQELTLSTKINESDTNLCYSSIHGSKGLESTSVLVIAYSKKELKKWLDFEKANIELDDDYRLGYVAFSRARDMLCIACLEKIDDDLKQKLISLNIVCHPNT